MRSRLLLASEPQAKVAIIFLDRRTGLISQAEGAQATFCDRHDGEACRAAITARHGRAE
jgi:hypothetical protein